MIIRRRKLPSQVKLKGITYRLKKLDMAEGKKLFVEVTDKKTGQITEYTFIEVKL